MGKLRFSPFAGTLDEWGDCLKTFPDADIFQTPAWLRFIAESQGGRIVVAALQRGGTTLGYFAGLVVKRLGFRILGSSFPGWTTPYMGIRLRDETERLPALQALEDYAFHELKCIHMEVFDRGFTTEHASRLGFALRQVSGFEVDLTRGEEELFAAMSSACRRCVRKAERSGVIVERAEDERFADEYYDQLVDVFAKQSLVPTYPRDRVRLLVRHLLPTGMLLLLRARDADGRCIATGIFPAMNRYMYFWGGPVGARTKSYGPTNSCSGMRCDIGGIAGLRAMTCAEAANTRENTGEETFVTLGCTSRSMVF